MSGISDRTLVLVVEDDDAVRHLTLELLDEAGFATLGASNSDAAVDLLVARSDIAVVLTDVEIPGPFSGYELAATIHENWPTIRVIVTSGVSLPQGHELPPGIGFLPKPYTPAALLERIRPPSRAA